MPAAALTFRQKLCLAVIVTAGAALRFESLWQTSLAHFDEGVLASGAFGVWLHGPYYFQLAQPLQAPPLFVWLVAAMHELTQTDWVIMGKMVSAAMATATIPAAFLLGARLQGVTFGLVAAALLAASDLHIAFARMALTDAPLTFWFTWAMYGWVRLVDAAVMTRDGAAAARRKDAARLIGWSLFTGLVVGAAWNTKYNGWMPLAIAATAMALALARDGIFPRLPRALPQSPGAWRRLLAAGGAVAALACLSFWPWRRFVDHSFAGGYQAVIENHRAYFGGPAEWPGRAWQLWVSLTAFRHYGWLLTLAAACLLLSCAGVGCLRKKDRGAHATSLLCTFSALAALAAAVPLGCDVALLLLAVAALAPALVYGRWEEMLLAVWLGSFVVLVPLYHPYARLMLPALPAAIYLVIWLFDAGCERASLFAAAGPSSYPPALGRLSRGMAVAAALGAVTLACATHPFGVVPSRALWQRWSTHDSYRAMGLLIDEHSPPDAMVLCQGLPSMPLYCPRRWLSMDQKPFTEFLASVPPDRPCYLAVDEWGIYGAGHFGTLETLRSKRNCLETVAWTRNDLNIVTLLDNLSPWAAARKLERAASAEQLDRRVRQPGFLPPALEEMGDDVVVLYRVDRACLGVSPAR